jgi:SAM-dependent methyltransferase
LVVKRAELPAVRPAVECAARRDNVRDGDCHVNDRSEFISLLHCPACATGALSRAGEGWQCGACAARFPDLDGVPWLFAAPDEALAEWRQRLQALLADLSREATGLRAALERPALAVPARNRLKLQAAALEDHGRRLAALLAPIGAGQGNATPEMHRALGTRIPGAQGLASYYVNLHRDWVWGAEENAAALAAVVEALGEPSPRRILVLGAGGGRLAYDLAQAVRPGLVVGLDINPLNAFVARRMFAGERVQLYEFPIAPRDAESHAILRTLVADRPLETRIELVLADASRAPFAPGSFDVIITPWLIDIIDEDFAAFSPRVNALLEPGGRWVNTGSLAFAQSDPALRYTLEEVLGLVVAAGFARPQADERRIPYMCSPASRHGRIESVVTFRAVKERAADAPPRVSMPAWLADPRTPVPALQEFKNAALTMRIYGYVASLIDGRRSLEDMAQVLVSERLMTADDALPAVRGFVQRLWEESRLRTRF